MKNKKLTSILAASLCACMLLTGCSHGGNADSPSGSSLTSGTGTQPTSDAGNDPAPSGSPGGSMPTYGATISVADIKNAYGASDGDIMPLYNVEPAEKFDFVFKADWFDKTESLDSTRIVTVHTHPSCSEESMLYIDADIEKNSDGGTKLTISPIGGVLSTDSEDMNELENGVDVWGNAQMYYIAVWYDPEADSFVKLDKPVVIPFTVKHELPVPTLKGNVDPTGRFKLVWTPVEGADGYNIYWFGNTNINRTGKINEPVAGAEQAFDVHGDCYFLKEATTEETEFDCFSGKDHGLAIAYHNDFEDMDYILGQNYSVNGSYFVTALFGDKESGLSNIVNTAELILPHVIVEEDDLMYKRFGSEADLPHTVRVLNVDGSVTERNVSYKFHWGTTLLGTKVPQYRYSVENTAITGVVSMESVDGKMELYKDKQEGDAPAGHIDTGNNTSVKSEPENATPFNPEADVPTIIEEGSGADNENKTLVERQTENTEKHVEKGNTLTVENSEYPVFADSAEEEWLARNLIAGKGAVSLEAFPGLQTYETLVDAFQKVYYQNPYVLGVTAYKYDYGTLTLNVNYCYSADELSKRQSELSLESNKIVNEVTSSDMSEEEKCRALYNYFNANTTYDKNALAQAEKFGYTKGKGWKESEDAFNAYGIIVKKTGVCQSYALSYKLLCHLCGVDSKVITGYLDDSLPHAWNAVKLGGKWYQTDCTNNETNCGIPFFLYEAGADDLEITGYTEDKLYELDLAVGRFAVADSEREYYEANGLSAADINEYKTVLASCLESDRKVTAIRYTGGRVTQDEIVRAVVEVYNMKGMEDKLATLGLGINNSFIILVEK